MNKTLNREFDNMRLRDLGLTPLGDDEPSADQLRERLLAAGLAPIRGASDFSDTRTILPSLSRAAATYTATYAKDHHAGMYLLIDVTVPNGGTVTPRASLKSQVNAADSKVIYQSAIAANAARAWVYLLYPAGLEGVTAVVTPDERVSLPLPSVFDLGFVVAVAAVTFSVEAFGLAL